jgi:ABC-type antimicrobial peptide transport system permease subunit
MVVIESVTLVAVAFVLSIPLAGALTELVITTSSAGLGFQGRFAFDWGAVPSVAILGLCVALAAALLPARQAATLDPVVALRLD